MSWDGFDEYYKELTRDQLVEELFHTAKQNNGLIDQNRELKLQNKELIEQNKVLRMEIVNLQQTHQNEQKLTDWTLRSLREQIASLEEKYKEYNLETVTTPRMLMMMSCQNPYIIDI
jgi:chromosome segregation ATPase